MRSSPDRLSARTRLSEVRRAADRERQDRRRHRAHVPRSSPPPARAPCSSAPPRPRPADWVDRQYRIAGRRGRQRARRFEVAAEGLAHLIPPLARLLAAARRRRSRLAPTSASNAFSMASSTPGTASSSSASKDTSSWNWPARSSMCTLIFRNEANFSMRQWTLRRSSSASTPSIRPLAPLTSLRDLSPTAQPHSVRSPCLGEIRNMGLWFMLKWTRMKITVEVSDVISTAGPSRRRRCGSQAQGPGLGGIAARARRSRARTYWRPAPPALMKGARGAVDFGVPDSASNPESGGLTIVFPHRPAPGSAPLDCP